jgi:hypothetical protein
LARSAAQRPSDQAREPPMSKSFVTHSARGLLDGADYSNMQNEMRVSLPRLESFWNEFGSVEIYLRADS